MSNDRYQMYFFGVKVTNNYPKAFFSTSSPKVYFLTVVLSLTITFGELQTYVIFETMQLANESRILVEDFLVQSDFLQRHVRTDFYLPRNVTEPSQMNLLLINDGQDMDNLHLSKILEYLYAENLIEPMLCVGLYPGEERKMEYGIASEHDYKGRGAKAALYTSFILDELIPFIKKKYNVPAFKEKAFAGFSLGGLSALDIVWNHPDEFCKVGVFSGSLWWRSVDQHDEEYDDDKHRIMQQQIRKGKFHPGLKFFFQCGNMDEKKDRNHNGIIDSIDDTLDLIMELKAKGYSDKEIFYYEMPDGHHDVATWAKAFPIFLKWGWDVSR